MEKKYRVAILYICTGKYVTFWKGFYQSFEQYFLKESRVEYFVFTDASALFDEENNERIHYIYQENLGWPGNTLFRFRMFNSIKEQLDSFDYVFFLNANLVCMKEITEEEFLPLEQDLLVVQHPGYYNSSVWRLPYERRKKSLACIPRGKGKDYVYGAVNGGKAGAFLRMTEALEGDIQKDFENGVIAKWHDESHLNHYVWRYSGYRILTPAYAYPEGWKMPFEEKIRVLDKTRQIQLDSDKIKELERKSIRKKFMRKIFREGTVNEGQGKI